MQVSTMKTCSQTNAKFSLQLPSSKNTSRHYNEKRKPTTVGNMRHGLLFFRNF